MTRDINFVIENPTQGNKKILDFLGLKMKDFKLPFGDQEAGKIIQVVDSDGKFGFVSGYQLEHFKFHTSYDWIIPVWQYIRDIKNEHCIVDECSLTASKCVIKALPIPYTKNGAFISVYTTTDFNCELSTVIWMTVRIH